MATKTEKNTGGSRKKLRVVMLSHSSEFIGGGERSMVDVFKYWADKGLIEPHFIIREPLRGLEKELQKHDWKYTAIHYGNWSQRNPQIRAEDRFRNARENAKAISQIEKTIEKIKPDVVLTNTLVAPWAAIAAHFKGLPHVWFVREYGDIDHGHTFELGREKTFQDIDNLSSLVVANSRTLEGYLTKYIKKDKLTTLYTPFDLDLLDRKINQDSDNPFKHEGSLRLVITGKIAKSKGQDQVAKAVGELNKKGILTELCIIGKPADSNGADSLEEVIKEYSIEDKVHLLGQQSNPLSIVRYADIGVMASQQEAFGRVTFEYMYAGKAVVGANSGATPELISNGVNGALYKSGDVKDLVKQLQKYANDPELATKQGKESRKIAKDMMNGEYNADSVFRKIENSVKLHKENSPTVLNFSRVWLNYPVLAQEYIDESRVISLKRLLYGRIRGYAKTIYLRVTGLLRRRGV